MHEEQMNVLRPYIDRGDIKVVADGYTKDWLSSEAYVHMLEAIDSAKENIASSCFERCNGVRRDSGSART